MDIKGQFSIFPPVRLIQISLLVLVTLWVYWPVYQFEFINFDDPKFVSENPYVREGLSPAGIKWALSADLTFDSPHADFWTPLTFLSHLTVSGFFGLEPGPHHLINVVLHLINTLILFGVLIRMTGREWPSAFTAALFALHPLHVESVAWVSERKDVLSGLFFMLTLWAYVRYRESPGLYRYSLIFLAMALGLMAKPMLITLPFVLLLLDYWPLKRIPPGGAGLFNQWKVWRGSVLEKIPLFLLTGASTAITFLAVKREEALASLDFGIRLGNALLSYAVYIRKLFWPVDLAVLYPHPGVTLGMVKPAAAGILLLVLTLFAFRIRQTHRYVIVGWFWFLGMLVPVIGLIQSGGQAMADRYTYLPLVGLIMMLAWGFPDLLQKVPGKKWVQGTVFVLVVFSSCMLASKQLRYWEHSLTVYQQAIRVTDRNFIAHNNLGMAYKVRGRYDEAIQEFRRALEIRPGTSFVHINMGMTYALQERYPETIRELRAGLELEPENLEAHFNLGIAYERLSQWAEARGQFQRVLEIDPAFPPAHERLRVLSRIREK